MNENTYRVEHFEPAWHGGGDAGPESILKARGLDRWPDEPLTTADLPRGDR